MATRGVLAQLLAAWQDQSGQPVMMESVGGVDAAKRVQAGEAMDLVVLASDAIDKLVNAGSVVAGSRVDLVHSGVAVAVRAGQPHPDISSEQGVRDAVLKATSIGYSTGPSGTALLKLFDGWGIAADIAPRLVQAPAGVPVGALVAKGEVELGFQQLSELMHRPGIDVVGPLPPEIQITTTFSAGVCAASTRAGEVRALLAFLASPQSAQAKQSHGMDPA
ncbi:substrate-binding domain-containing protein [Caenimonas sp. SL110]|uniref:substrate-binding domain-containing protein n=1 Tax=Caenimonas sp. SL110 TaxID=1450524 RepID=UPI00065379F0|nr:substrate-binding domain-containing protein [Caenimonas sp. SL110]